MSESITNIFLILNMFGILRQYTRYTSILLYDHDCELIKLIFQIWHCE